MGETGLESPHWVLVLTPLFPLPFCRTISGNVNGKKENATETHGTRNGTHGDVGKIDMCVLNPAPWNPGWKWGGAGVSQTLQSEIVWKLYKYILSYSAVQCIIYVKHSFWELIYYLFGFVTHNNQNDSQVDKMFLKKTIFLCYIVFFNQTLRT